MIKQKRAQANLISTVLIILVVLAAVAIVAAIVMNMVKKGGEEVESKSQCLGIQLSIEKVVRGGSNVNVTVSRGADSIDQGDLIIKVTGTGSSQNGTSVAIAALESKMITIDHSSLSSGDLTVTTALKMTDGTLCEGESKTATPTTS